MRYIIFLLLIGCANPQPFDVSEIDGKIFRFQVKFVDTMPDNLEGLHIYDERIDLHTIVLIRDNYPYCYLHEALHMFHGNWHKGRDSTEYCNSY